MAARGSGLEDRKAGKNTKRDLHRLQSVPLRAATTSEVKTRREKMINERVFIPKRADSYMPVFFVLDRRLYSHGTSADMCLPFLVVSTCATCSTGFCTPVVFPASWF